MTWFLIVLSNLFLYAALRIHLVRKFRTSYSIYLKDGDGKRQTLTATIAHLLEADELLDKKIMYLAQEMEKQWMNIEQIALVTGAEKYCTEKPQQTP